MTGWNSSESDSQAIVSDLRHGNYLAQEPRMTPEEGEEPAVWSDLAPLIAQQV